MAHWVGTQIMWKCPPRSLARQGRQLDFADGHSHWLGSPLGCCCKEEGSLPSAGCLYILSSSVSQYDFQGSRPTDSPLQIPPVLLWQDPSGPSGKQPITPRELDIHLGLFPSGETVGPGDLWLNACLGEVAQCLPWRGDVIRVQPFLSFLIDGPFQSLWSREVLHPYLYVLEFSQQCLVHGQLLIDLPVKGTEVSNNLCHHLNGITPQKTPFVIGKGGTGRRYSQYIYLIKDMYLESIKKSYNSVRQTSQYKNFEQTLYKRRYLVEIPCYASQNGKN